MHQIHPIYWLSL